MGKVIKQGVNTSRFVIQDKLGLYLIALIFNGKIVTPLKLESFNVFLKYLNRPAAGRRRRSGSPPGRNIKTLRGRASKNLKEFGLNKDIFKEIKPL